MERLEIPLKQLSPSPFNPRTSFDGEALAVLAEDLRRHGVLQPLLVRPKLDATSGKAAPNAYELVFGHRRLEAAKRAGLETVPVTVRQMSDIESVEAAVVENDQREDLHPLDRASGYHQLKAFGLNVDQIAEKVGKSRASVYATLKLLDLVGPAQDAVREGKLNFSIAERLARVPAKLQPKALKQLLTPDHRGDLPSVRAAGELLHDEYMLDLKSAKFDTLDSQLVPAAGDCSSCPKRTGSQPDLFTDVKGPDVCTDVPCYRSKELAWLKQQEAAGTKVLSAKLVSEVFRFNEDRPDSNSGYVAADEKDWGSGKTYRQKLGKEASEHIALARAPDGSIVEVIPKKALEAKEKADAGDGKARKADPEEKKRKEELALRKATCAQVLNELLADAQTDAGGPKWLQAIVMGLTQVIWKDALKRVCARRELDVDDPAKSIRGVSGDMTSEELRGLVLELALAQALDAGGAFSGGYHDELKRVCSIFGIDLKDTERTVKRQLDAAKKAQPKVKKAKGKAAA